MKKAIYTCIIGSYDSLRQPCVQDNGYDFILFVAKGTKKQDRNGVWQIRELDYVGTDNVVTSRYPKLNPHKVLPEYEYTLWMDGNLAIIDEGFYRVVNEKIAQGVDYAGVKHPDKNCVYEDIEGCMHAMRDKPANIWRAAKFLVNLKFPRHYGMYENNIILRRTASEAVRSFNEEWWNLYLDYPRRDQFTAPVCLRDNGIPFIYLLPEGDCAKTSPWIEYIEHNETPKSTLRSLYDYFACRVRTYMIIIYLKLYV